MITAKLGDYFLWMGKIVKVEWINMGNKSIGFKTTKTVKCPHCEREHEIEDHNDVIESSPQFQKNAKPINTITIE